MTTTLRTAPPPSPLPPLVIHASAGSGKTYTLTNRYLRLAATVPAVESVLATTFTRLAAGEIRDRVLVRLVEAEGDAAARAELAEALGRAALDDDDVRALLRYLTTNVSRLQVRTLDSFFGTIARSFALELGLSPGAAILDEDEAVALRMQAIDRVFERLDTTRIGPLLRRLTEGNPGRAAWSAVEREILPLHDLYREAPLEAWDRLARQPVLEGEALDEALEVIEHVALPADKRLANARRNVLRDARAGLWQRVLEARLVGTIASGEMTFARKTLDVEVGEAFAPLIAHARGALLNQLRDRLHAMRELLEAFHVEYRTLKQEAGLVTFDDVTHALADGVGAHALDDIYYRIDARVRHVLLDEFQDTSMLQWRALRPIVDEILAHGETPDRSLFVVGDMKQSIYGWRNACPEILETMPERLGIATRALDVSWRSGATVLGAVDDVFTAMADSAALDRDEDRAAARRFAADYRPHEPSPKTAALPGYVELAVTDVDPKGRDKAARARRRLREAAELAQRLQDEAPGSEIAILTRTNEAVARLLYELGQCGVAASGRGGSALTDTPPVESILDLLRFADHPDDTISLFNVAAGPLGPPAGVTVADCARAAAPRRAKIARSIRDRLVTEGYAAVIADWVTRIAPACNARERARLEQLVSIASSYESRATLRTGPFITLVETRRVEAGRTALVQVMTVHQAKGLDFDVVILPDLQDGLAGRSPRAAYRRGDELGDIDTIVPWIKTEARAHLPELEPLFDEDRSRRVREGLCLLYVAMTRAKRGLFMLVDPRSNRATAARALCETLAPGLDPAPGTVLHARGDRDWARGLTPGTAPVSVPEPAPPIELASPSGAIGRDAARPASAVERTVADALRLDDADAIDRGRAMHALFEQIEWLDDAAADVTDATRAAWRDVAARTAPRRDATWLDAIIDDFVAALGRPAVRELLTPDPLLPVEVRREHPYALIVRGEADAEAAGRVQEGAIDRLELWRDAHGRVVGARVIDFKTDRFGTSRVTHDEAAGHAENYRRQLEAYRAVTARIHDLPRERVEMVVLFVEPGVAIRLTG